MPGTVVREAPISADAFADLPDDGQRRELVNGMVQTMTPAGGRHGRVGATLLGRLYAVVARDGLGDLFTAETGFLLSRAPDTVRAPDVAFIRCGRLTDGVPAGFVDVIPDLVCEVVSPSDRSVDVSGKALAWVDAGVAVVWVVDPANRSVTVHDRNGVTVLRGDDELTAAEVVPGFALRLSELWI